MPRTWYNLVAGPAPWKNATSYTETGPFYSRSSYTTDGDVCGTSITNYFSIDTANSFTYQNGATYIYKYSNGLRSNSHSASFNNAGPSYLATGTEFGSSTENYLSGFYAVESYTFQRGTGSTATVGTDTVGTNSETNTNDTRLRGLSAGTLAVTTGYVLGTQNAFVRVDSVKEYNSDYDSPRYIIVSTQLTNGTGTDAVIYVSTTYQTESYTYLTSEIDIRVIDFWSAQTTSYIRFAYHEVPVVSALEMEFLCLQTATGSTGVSDGNQLLGNTFYQTTLGDVLSTFIAGAPYANTSKTNTIYQPVVTLGTITCTVSTLTQVVLTEQSFNGWIGGTNTRQISRTGLSTRTQEQTTAGVSFLPYTIRREWPVKTYIPVLKVSIFSETITGINALGGSAIYADVQTPIEYTEWSSYFSYEGFPGQSVTKKLNPRSAFWGFVFGAASLYRLERYGGFQKPLALGSTAEQGVGLSAASSFFVGFQNTITGSPKGIITPAVKQSTASTSNSRYSFNLDSSACSVTRVVSNYTASTATSDQFTVTIDLIANANSFVNTDNSMLFGNVTVVGGPHAWTGGQQKVTSFYECGYRYTIGDALGTTSYKQTQARFSTQQINGSIMAVDTFSAGLPYPILSEGNNSVLAFPHYPY